jgi:hypothetical protein
MFYKYWKQLSLALTGFFWASCNSTTTTEPLYGVPPDLSSSSSEVKAQSSSSENKISSSSEPLPMPAYGVEMYCEVVSEQGSTITCENGYTCIAKTDTIHVPAPECKTFDGTTICPDYGVAVDILAPKYECEDGLTYDEQTFHKHYKK